MIVKCSLNAISATEYGILDMGHGVLIVLLVERTTNAMNKENKILLINDAVDKLCWFSSTYGINSLFIAGGYCRSLYLNRIEEVNDIDVASAYSGQSILLGGLFASEVVKAMPVFYHRTGTAMIEYKSDIGTIKIEFQGSSPQPYMQNRRIRDWIHKNKLDDSPLIHNIYGRDFSINAMIYSLDKKELFDPTHWAVKDFNNKIIRSLIPPGLLLLYNPITALRAIRLALTYDFKIHKNLEKLMHYIPDLLMKSYSEERIMKEVIRILHINGEKAINMFKRYKIEKILYLPSIKEYLENLKNAE